MMVGLERWVSGFYIKIWVYISESDSVAYGGIYFCNTWSRDSRSGKSTWNASNVTSSDGKGKGTS